MYNLCIIYKWKLARNDQSLLDESTLNSLKICQKTKRIWERYRNFKYTELDKKQNINASIIISYQLTNHV